MPEVIYQQAQKMTGRMDSLRMHQLIKPVDLLSDSIPVGSFAIIGIKADKGIERNGGRLGAKEGPDAIRSRLAPLPIHSTKQVVDAGDIILDGDNLEKAHETFTQAVQQLYRQDAFPIALGGGYDMVFPFVEAHMAEYPKEPVAVVSLSPFANVRPLENGKGNSGTEFAQIAQKCQEKGADFAYMVYGYQPQVNTLDLENRLKEVHATTVDAKDIMSTRRRFRNKAAHALDEFIKKHDHIILTMEMNEFAQAFAPGVSAVSPWGIFPQQGREVFARLAQSGKLDGVVIAEVSPTLDDANGSTARLAAGLIVELLEKYQPPRKKRRT